MHPAAELLWTTLVMLLWSVYGIIKVFIPASILHKKSIKGQLVLVTGAGSGLGRMMSERFAKLGCNLVLWDVNQKGNEETADLVREQGMRASTYTVDLSEREDIYKAADLVKSEVGNVDILVNNAGIVTGRKFLQSPDHLIQKTMDVNVMAHFWTIKAFLPYMMKKNRGHVVSIASGAGFNGINGLCDYCASKFAAVGLDESLRNELQCLGKDGVDTTAVCPYYINTGMFDGVQSKYPFILPILEPDYAIDKIFEAILTRQEIIMLPRILYWVAWLKTMIPSRCYCYMATATGVNASMDTFIGRLKRD